MRVIERVLWEDIKHEIKKVSPSFYNYIEAVNPGKTHPLYVLSFQYGDMIGDDKSQFIPNDHGELIHLSSDEVPKRIRDELGYGMDSAPLGMLLDKSIEFFIDLPEKQRTIPVATKRPGEFYNFTRMLSRKSDKKPAAPNGLLNASAGGRTVFSLPKLTCKKSFNRLVKDIGLIQRIPASLYEQWDFFKEIVNSKKINSKWRAKLIYFSEGWIDSILSDSKWKNIKNFAFEQSWSESEYTRNQYYYDISYSLMLEKANFDVNPYINDTARHILDIALGIYPGMSPAINDDLLPLHAIQHAIYYSYGLKKYVPTIMQPQYFSIKNEDSPVYYSLYYPTTRSFSPKSKKTATSVDNIDNLRNIIESFILQINSKESMWQETELQHVASRLKINYMNNKEKSSKDSLQFDKRLYHAPDQCYPHESSPACESLFFNGCLKISAN